MSRQTAEIDIQLTNGNEAGKTMNQLTAESVKLHREIKKLEIGSEEWVQKTQEYRKINGRLKEVKKEVYATDKAQGMLNSTIGQFVPFNSQIGRFIGTYSNVSQSIGGATKAQRLLNIVFKAFPLGFIIGLLASLISYLTTTQEGMDKLRRVTMPLMQIFERLKGVLQELGGTVFKGLAQIMQGDVRAGFRTLREGASQLREGITGAFTEGLEAGRRLADMTEEIEKRTNELELSRARLNRQIQEEREIASDMSKSEQERQAAAQRAIDLINERTNQEKALLDLQIEKMKLEHEANDTSRADEHELQKLLAQREELEATAARERRRLVNQANDEQIRGQREVTASTKTEIDNRLKAEENAQKKLEDLRIQTIQDGTERKIAQLELAHEREMEAFQGNEEQRREFAKLSEARLIEEIEELRQKAAEESFQQKLDRMKEEEDIERMEMENAFHVFLMAEEERDHLLYEQKQEALERRLEMIRRQHGEESLAYKELYAEILKNDHDFHEQQIKNAEQAAEVKRRIEQEQMAFARDMLGMGVEMLNTDEESRRKHAGAIRVFAIGQILADLQREIAGYMASPASTFTLGVSGAAKSIAAGVRAGIAVRNVMNQQFEKGGVVHGPSHAAGGIPFTVRGRGGYEMEGGETILAKGVYADPVLRGIASQINELGGGRRFAMGGPVVDRPMVSPSDRREVIRELGGGTDMSETNGYLKEIAKNTEKAANRPVPISIQKVRNGLEMLSDVEEDART